MNREELRERVIQAAEKALVSRKYVSPIDVLTGSGLLQAADVEDWRRGRVGVPERRMRGNLSQISEAMRVFRQWGAAKGLKPSETAYKRHTRGSRPDLRFSVSGRPDIERAYRTHFVDTGKMEV